MYATWFNKVYGTVHFAQDVNGSQDRSLNFPERHFPNYKVVQI